MIELIIHQIWHPFACDSMPAAWERFSRGWRRWHPRHRYILWQPEESREFVARKCPSFLGTYDAYNSPMKRVAALRYLLLRHLGGMVVDLDMECLRNVEPLLADTRLLLSVQPRTHWPAQRLESDSPLLSTAFMASASGHPFWDSVIGDLSRSAQLPGLGESAGASLLTRCYDAFEPREAVSLSPPEAFHPVDLRASRSGSAYDVGQWLEATASSYAVHHWAGTWDRPGLDPLPARRPYAQQGLPARIHDPRWGDLRPGQLVDGGPLVSCLMVTRGWVEPARWAVEAFRNQSYGNRELVVVTTNREGDLPAYLSNLRDPTIRLLDPLPVGTPLGAQRNEAVKAARGELICTWDDDDLYGVDRLAASVTAIATTGAAAAFLERIGVWWPARQVYSVTHRRKWENTMVAQRSCLVPYPAIDRAEDTAVIDAILAKHPVVTVDDPNLYTYVVWGTNTWGTDHFQTIVRQATYRAEQLEYDRVLSVLDKHVPILHYLAWLQRRDPKTYDPPIDSPAQLSALPARRSGDETGTRPRLVRPPSAVPIAAPGQALRFLLASERRGGLGHTTTLAQVARPLLDAGHDVHLAVSDLTTTYAALGQLAGHPRLHQWQAPVPMVPAEIAGGPCCYAEFLLRDGYHEPARLGGLVNGWTSLFRQIRPDLLLAEHAPTALLAARGLPFSRAILGPGFFLPPPESPLPGLPDWKGVPLARVEEGERRVLATCNAVLSARGGSPMSAAWQLNEADEQFLTTVPELDEYRLRATNPAQEYRGFLEPADQGMPAAWPRGIEPAVFAYLRPEHRATESALKALRDGPWRSLVFSPGLPRGAAGELSSKSMAVVTEPVDMKEVCETCDVIVCNSGWGTVGTALCAGKPVLLLPHRLEQSVLAKRVQGLGAGLVLQENQVGLLPDALTRILSQPSYGEAARAFARRYAPRPGEGVAAGIAARCAELATKAKTGRG